MGTVTANVRVRDGAGNSAACLVETFNAWHNMIVQSGMIQLSESDYSGQAGVFSENAGSGLTQVVKHTERGVDKKVGYKVYKHPTLSLYFKIWFIDFNQTLPESSSFARFKCQFSTSLNGSGGFVATKTSNEFYPTDIFSTNSTSSSYTINLQYFPAVFEKMTVSCGPDHFWIARDSGIETFQHSSYYTLPLRIDIYSVGVFTSLQDPDVLCLAYQQDASTLSSSRPVGPGSSGESRYSCLRYMLCNKGDWSLLDNGAAGQLDHPRVTNTVDGVRVAQAKLVVDGIFHRFNFGFIPHKVLSSFSVITLNMTGVDQKYQHLPYMGVANHSMPVNDFSNSSSVIFPVVG